jgi:hypothetical protein
VHLIALKSGDAGADQRLITVRARYDRCKLGSFLPNEVITTGMADLACAYRAGAVDRAVDD